MIVCLAADCESSGDDLLVVNSHAAHAIIATH